MRFSPHGILLVAATIAHSVAVPSPSYVVHEKRDVSSRKWVKRDRVAADAILPMRIGLKQRNLHRGDDFLMDVSDPNSSNYAKHWTVDEIISMFSPEQETVDTVREWLVGAGVDPKRITHTDNKAWLAFDATTIQAEKLLETKYHLYEHASTGHIAPACDSYHLPQHIRKHVDYITPGIKLLAPSKRTVSKRTFGITSGQGTTSPKVNPEALSPPSPNDLSTCDTFITPACIKALYQIPAASDIYVGGIPRADNSLGIFEEGDYYSQQDLNSFFANFTPAIPQGTHPAPAFIDGAEAPVPVAEAGGESLLDFELAYPIIYPQKITLYQTDDIFYATNPNSTAEGGFNTFLEALDGSYCSYINPLDPVYPDPSPDGYKGQLQCGVYKPTNVISISYGGQEADLPNAYQQRQCNEFMKLGLLGVSLLFASGDDGVAGYPGDPVENGCLGVNATIFNPAWPNNCPYVTNVGATKVYPNMTVYQPESAVVDTAGHPYRRAFSSGGGFSNIYPRPSYQRDAVHDYFDKYDPGYKAYRGNDSFGIRGGIYNRLGRAYPDVAANGDNIAVFVGGTFAREGGTSASTPIFASIVNLINEQRLNAGKKSLGFLNPALYANPSMLNDITNGSNPGCGTNGFPAAPGWDPVTGLGTPNYPKMLKYFMSLP